MTGECATHQNSHHKGKKNRSMSLSSRALSHLASTSSHLYIVVIDPHRITFGAKRRKSPKERETTFGARNVRAKRNKKKKNNNASRYIGFTRRGSIAPFGSITAYYRRPPSCPLLAARV